MGQKYLVFLLGFEVRLRDRRNKEETEGFLVVPYPEEHPEELVTANETIKHHFGRLGYDVLEIKHKESKVIAMDLMEQYNSIPTTAEYADYAE